MGNGKKNPYTFTQLIKSLKDVFEISDRLIKNPEKFSLKSISVLLDILEKADNLLNFERF